MQPYLWLWLLLAPPVLALIDLITSSPKTHFAQRGRAEPRDTSHPAANPY